MDLNEVNCSRTKFEVEIQVLIRNGNDLYITIDMNPDRVSLGEI